MGYGQLGGLPMDSFMIIVAVVAVVAVLLWFLLKDEKTEGKAP